MKFAADFRRLARDGLRGRWAVAVIAGLLAALLGAGVGTGTGLQINVSNNSANVQFAGQNIYTSSGGWNRELAGSRS